MAEKFDLFDDVISIGKKIVGAFIDLFGKWYFWVTPIICIIVIFSGGKIIKTTNDLEGTTWQNTSTYNSDNFWIKVVLKTNRTYDAWYANPSKGKWDNYHSGSYTVEEDRDNSNGKEVFILCLHGSSLPGVSYLIVYKNSDEGRFSRNSFIENKYKGIEAIQTDENPWD
jgi:hypothetical protein